MKQFTKLALSVLLAAFIMLCGMTTVTSAQDNDKYPKPDFKEMEKWYEVVKFEYNIIDRELKFLVKPKTQSRPGWWKIEWFDGDGVSVYDQELYFKEDAKVGETIGVASYFRTPTEGQMDKMLKSVTLTRIKN